MTKLTNRVISVFDKKTSMRLAAREWTAVDDICKYEHIKRQLQLLDSKVLNVSHIYSVLIFTTAICPCCIFPKASF